jgi:hypothetical protein
MHVSSTNLLALYVTEKRGVEAGGTHASKTAKLGSSFATVLRWTSPLPPPRCYLNRTYRVLPAKI